MEEMEGVFPSQFDMMMKIPGIGRSTAGAISAFSFNQKKAILDGNVKRVLSRYFLVTEWTGLPKTEKKLWDYAESVLPNKNIATYTQALMDLGATVCNKKALCETCPLKETCLAFQKNKVHLVPAPRPRKKIPTETTHMVIIKHHDEVLLIKRPQGGIWGGLWSLPQYEDQSATSKTWIKKHFGLEASLIEKDLKASTTFTHYKLDITYSILEAKSQHAKLPHTWLSINALEGAAIPAIIKRILLKL
jgi:A/G-specific adenine glycosylase